MDKISKEEDKRDGRDKKHYDLTNKRLWDRMMTSRDLRNGVHNIEKGDFDENPVKILKGSRGVCSPELKGNSGIWISINDYAGT